MPESSPDRVLVIDDSPLALAIVRNALEGAGYRVSTATDGPAGLAALASQGPDLVLCDLTMPQMGGLEVLHQMQRHAPATPVLIFTEESAVDTAVEAMRRGAAGYVLKGATDDQLALEVRSALERRRAAELRRSQLDRLATMGTLAAGVAHEINTPLGYVRSNVDFLRQLLLGLTPEQPIGGESRAEALAALGETLQGLERMTQIVRDMKALSRRDERSVLVNLAEVVGSAARMAAPAIRERARFTTDIQELPVITGDPGRLVQVVINLLVNAAQAIEAGNPGGHEVGLVARKDGDGAALIEVRDTGAGMTEEVKGRLFEPFFTTKPANVGTGLGLSISQSIVAAHSGTISVDSAVGRGSVFRIRLPSAASAS